MSGLLWGILGNIIAYYIIIYAVPLICGLLTFFWVKHKENLWRATLAGLVCCTCLLVISNILASNYNEYSRTPIPLAYEEFTVPTDSPTGLPVATLNNLIALHGNNLSATVFVKGNTITYRLDGGIPTSSTIQQMMEESYLTLESLAAIKNFRAIALRGPANIAVTYYKGHLK